MLYSTCNSGCEFVPVSSVQYLLLLPYCPSEYSAPFLFNYASLPQGQFSIPNPQKFAAQAENRSDTNFQPAERPNFLESDQPQIINRTMPMQNASEAQQIAGDPFEDFDEKLPAMTRKKYPAKNAESNISKQALSFLTSKIKSLTIFEKVVQHSGSDATMKSQLFYLYGRIVKRDHRKYTSRKRLLAISYPSSDGVIQQLRQSGVYSEKLPVEEFCRLNRILLKYFFDNVCALGIVTSKKIHKGIRQDHLWRSRHISRYLTTESEIRKLAQ